MLTPEESGRLGGLTSAANMTPEQRSERARNAYLQGAVNTIVNRAGDFTPEQIDFMRPILGPVFFPEFFRATPPRGGDAG